MEQITLTQRGPVVTVTLNRPAVHNAFHPQMIQELDAAFTTLAEDEHVHVVVLTGAGSSFCAGADLHWMQDTLHYTEADNLADARRMAAMFDRINRLPKPLIGRINGAAVGGGAGLVACCDVAISTADARFGFAEVKLGLIPAVVARFVVPKIGVSHARALFVSGRRFSAEKAREIGLVHDVVPTKDFDRVLSHVVDDVLTSGPRAVEQSKHLIDALMTMSPEEADSYTTAAIAAARTSSEGQEGVRAFLEKRPAAWLKP